MKQEAQMFSMLFKGLDRAYQKVTLLDTWEDRGTKGKKRDATVFWIKKQVTVETYERHLNGKQGIGIGTVTDSNTCFFGVIDIDDYTLSDKYSLNLCHRIEQLKLPLIPAKSKSGGLRLYVFCEETPGNIVSNYLRCCASLLAFPKDMKVEFFPSAANIIKEREDYGKGIALPYFNSDKTTCAAFWKEKILTTSEFIKLALSKLCRTTDLKNIPGIDLGNAAEFSDGPPCLQSLSINGFPEGTRDSALYQMGVYLRLKHGDDAPDRYLDEYNDKFLKPPLDSNSVVKAMRSVKSKSYWYKCKEEPFCNSCNKDLCLTRKYGIGSGKGESNIVIGAMTKLDTTPPIWLVEVNNRRIQMETEDFTDIRRFTIICIEKLHIIPNLTLARLKLMVNKSLETATTEDAPEDASIPGQCLALFHQYLHSKPPAKNKEEVIFGAPWYEEGHVYFRGKDFTDYLEMEKFRLDSRKVWTILREFNLEKGGSKDQTTFRINDQVIKVRRIKFDKPNFVVEIEDEDF